MGDSRRIVEIQASGMMINSLNGTIERKVDIYKRKKYRQSRHPKADIQFVSFGENYDSDGFNGHFVQHRDVIFYASQYFQNIIDTNK